MFRDVPKPKVVCPECGHIDAFFHCARQDDHGTYDWGTLVTCLRCKTPFGVETESNQSKGVIEKGTKMKPKITIYQTKCKLCGAKITGPDEQTCHDLLTEHLDDNCKMAQKMRSWELAGIYPQMMALLRQEGLMELIRKKILKHYSLDEVRAALEYIEMGQ